MHRLVTRAIRDDTKTPPLFACLPIKRVWPLSSLQRLLAEPAIAMLLGWLRNDARLACDVGCNAGTGAVSVVIELPDAALNAAVEKSLLLRRKEDASPAMLRCAAIWMMLGLMPQQCAIEREHAAAAVQQQQQSASSESKSEGKAQKQQLVELQKQRDAADEHAAATLCAASVTAVLANRCLLRFMQQTHVAIAALHFDVQQRTLRITLDTAVRGLRRISDGVPFKDDMTTPYLYAPCYAALWDDADARRGAHLARFAAKRAALVNVAIADFWAILRRRQYIADGTLKAAVTTSLRAFLSGGMRQGAAVFRPRDVVKLYLYGGPGIGKSAFVAVCSYALRILISRYFEPGKQVDIVRCPLNSSTPATMQRLLRVKGLSDWSMERILEQTICKGGMVVFHLEENPRDTVLQTRFFALIQELLELVTRRYPEHACNVLYIFTSNYAAAPSIAAQCAALVRMRAPSRDAQRAWCRSVLADVVKNTTSALQGAAVRIELRRYAPESADMRPLVTWKNCVGFAVAQHVKASIAALKKKKTNNTTAPLPPLQCCVVTLHADKTSKHNVRVSVALGSSSCSSNSTQQPLKPVLLKSSDGFFYYNGAVQQQQQQQQQQQAETKQQLLYAMTDDVHARVVTVLSMQKELFLKPAVIVLTGTAKARAACTARILSIAAQLHDDDDVVGDGGEDTKEKAADVQHLHIVAKTDADKPRLFGDPDPLSGVLFRFIDKINNPVYTRTRRTYGIIVSRVNTLGQFMLRDLFQEGVSSTHVTYIRKAALCFVVSIEGDASSISPQLQSRAHAILAC
jgi:hypothetical protein